MPRNLLQDIIKVKHVNREMRVVPHSVLGSIETGPKAPQTRYKLWFVAIISLIFFLYSISSLFSRVVVTINPKMQNVVLNENLFATLSGGIEEFSFDLIVISGEENKIVKTTEEKEVSERAEGTVLIYNAFSSTSQRLDIGTRLEGSNGKIYKTKKQIVLPGMNDTTPGFIEVDIYGLEAGNEYNSAPLDFTIFGFKGTPKYAKFYARSKEEITGGFKGKASIISDAEKSIALNDLKTTLQGKLLKKATDQIPNGFILFKDAVYMNINDTNIDVSFSKDNMLPINMKGTLYGFLFNEKKLTQKIVENSVKEYDGSDVFIPNIRDLVFSVPAQAVLTSPANKDYISFTNNLSGVKNINFNLKGTTKIVWKLDENKLVTDLLSKSKKDFNQVLLQYPNIDSADLVISPFWKMTLPNKTKNIKVIVNYPK
ncbi:hypothetical protein EXS45_01550 [Candidatus Nomurabacteria bacterium]|nr:hypothetical protein [Candidatus Nomurabacteria bacterium]